MHFQNISSIDEKTFSRTVNLFFLFILFYAYNLNSVNKKFYKYE